MYRGGRGGRGRGGGARGGGGGGAGAGATTGRQAPRRRRGPHNPARTNPALARGRNPMDRHQQQEWLLRSRNWPDMRANNYVGKKVLGAGAHGIVGLWQYKGNSAALPKHLVVKQVVDMVTNSAEQLRVESKLLRDIMATGTDHIIKLYKSNHTAGGTGTSNSRDPLPFGAAGQYDPARLVNRIYVEYCRNGDLESELRRIADKNQDIPEEYIWRILHCLASALAILEHGSEKLNKASWNTPIGHFDIKPQNILVGDHDGTHPTLPIFKLGDFGLALALPAEVYDLNQWANWNAATRQHWIHDTEWRATPGYTPPEQLYANMNPRRIGFRSDVWSTGVVLYELMTKTVFQTHVEVDNGNAVEKHFKQSLFKKTLHTFAGPIQFDTFGRDLLVRPYSMRLIDLAHKCLAWDAQRRPSSRQILRIATFTLNQVFKKADPPDPMVYLSENIPGARISNHILLQRFGPGAVNNAAPGVAKPVVGPPLVFVPDWIVGQENQNPQLPPFVAAQPLNPNDWPWTSLKEPKALRQDPVQTRAEVARDARRDRRLGGN